MSVLTKDVLLQFSKVHEHTRYCFWYDGQPVTLQTLSQIATITVGKVKEFMTDNIIFEGKKIIVYNLDCQFEEYWHNETPERYQAMVNLIKDIVVPELKKIFVDSTIKFYVGPDGSGKSCNLIEIDLS